jgi:protein TonB
MYPKINFLSDWSDAVDAKRNSIVFENKNQAYGAFVIRTTYDRNLIIALFSSFIFFAALILIPMLLSHRAIPLLQPPPTFTKPTILTEAPPIIIDPPTRAIHPPSTPPPAPRLNLLNLQTTNNDDEDTTEILPVNNPPENPIHHEGGGSKEGTTTETTIIIKPPVIDPNKIWDIPSEMPAFPGGENELFKFLNKELKYPDFPLKNGIEGTVYLTFVINRDGSVGDIKILRGVDNFLNDEAIRVVKKMPKWKPGKQNGNAVRVQLNLPVKFKIREN